MITAGQLDTLVNLENPSDPVPDPRGTFTETWLPLSPAQVWAHIDAASQADMEQSAAGAGTIIGQALFTVDLFYHPQITLKTRLSYVDPDHGQRTFQVASLRNPDNARRELVLVVSELQP